MLPQNPEDQIKAPFQYEPAEYAWTIRSLDPIKLRELAFRTDEFKAFLLYQDCARLHFSTSRKDLRRIQIISSSQALIEDIIHTIHQAILDEITIFDCDINYPTNTGTVNWIFFHRKETS